MTRRRINWRGWLILIGLTIVSCGILFFMIIRPLVIEYAKNKIMQTASYAIHDALTAKIYTNRSEYEKLVQLERDNDNRVTALKTDTILADYLKVQLARTTYDALNTLERSTVDVPLGTVLFPTLMAGRGPVLKIGITSLGYADADFISAFTSAGINQTRHQILLDVRAEAYLVTIFGGTDVSLKNQMAVTDTVIVGNVPESYTYIDDTEQSLLGKVNDYAE